jgi:hypothetical protein
MLNLLPDHRVGVNSQASADATEEVARQEVEATRQRTEEVAERERRWKEEAK